MAAEIRHARAVRGWSRQQVIRRAGVSADTERRIEVGEPAVQLDTLCAVADALGLDVVVTLYPARQASLRDTGQLTVADQIRSIASPAWTPRLEVAAGERGEAADLVLYGATEIVVLEIERLVVDFQDQYRRDARKRDWLAERHRRPVRLVLAIEETERNRRLVGPHGALIGSALPARTREVLRSVRTGEPLGRDGLVWIRRRRPPQR